MKANYIVSFISKRNKGDDQDYEDWAKAMAQLAQSQYNCLKIMSVRDEKGQGITMSYWHSLEDIKAWRDNTAHRQAQKLGHEKWYTDYHITTAKITKDYKSDE